MTPNIDRNEAPETWITAAPVDTLTTKDPYGRPDPVGGPTITTIPVRFHLYWAASDRDGAIAGFYYAVVETTATPVDGIYMPLPGPKPSDYRFTTKTDTTFVFTVSELFTDRRHAFYIYAVDNNGKPDASPARFIFTAIDKFPPRPWILEAQASGPDVMLSYGGDPIVGSSTVFVQDSLKPGTETPDTVAMNSQLTFRWNSLVTLDGTYVTRYRYKLDESTFQEADSSMHVKTYDPPIAPGVKIFTLRALDQANGAGETTKRFYMNRAPNTWWAGPDPSLFTGTDGEYGSHCVDVIRWPRSPDIPEFVTNPPLPPGSTYGPDSMQYRPSKRYPPDHDFDRPGTFFEIYKNKLYARTEGDTVHMNSYVVLWNGGHDRDSRYEIFADSTDPILRPAGYPPAQGPVIEDAGLVGSPIGFRSMIINRLTPTGLKVPNAQTSIYPVYEPASVYRSPRLGGYWRMIQAGKSYAIARAEDADGTIDRDVADPQVLADNVDAGGGTPEERALRRKVLVFYVDKSPALVKTDPLFTPREGQSISSVQWQFHLVGMDLDPFDPNVVGPSPGGPTGTSVTRFKVTLYGKSLPALGGRDTSWTYREPSGLQYINQGTPVEIYFTPGGSMQNNPFDSGPIQVSIQICDCVDCEFAPGQGRCVDGIDGALWDQIKQSIDQGQGGDLADAITNPSNVITVTYTRPAAPAGIGATSMTGGRPGSDPSGKGE